jgi:hypothetical protein
MRGGFGGGGMRGGGRGGGRGVIAQEVQAVMPSAVVRGWDGYLRVFYYKLGIPFQTYDQWIASGAHVPTHNRH